MKPSPKKSGPTHLYQRSLTLVFSNVLSYVQWILSYENNSMAVYQFLPPYALAGIRTHDLLFQIKL
jgi:hypothetical protein